LRRALGEEIARECDGARIRDRSPRRFGKIRGQLEARELRRFE
jgi:hypothetical protein